MPRACHHRGCQGPFIDCLEGTRSGRAFRFLHNALAAAASSYTPLPP